jgi:multidrug efflux pump subunit AcrA (membrane-fusion protein)
MKRIIVIALAVIVVGLIGWRWRALESRHTATAAPIRTAAVTRGALVVTLPVNGALESAEETPVRIDLAGTLLDICQDNAPVKPGDLAFQLDTKDLRDQRDILERALTDAQEAASSQEADNVTRTTQAESDADTARESLKLAQEKAQAEREKIAAQVKFAESEAARAERELARAQRLAKLNYIAGTKLRDAEQAYRQKQFHLEQQKAQAADTEKRTVEQVRDARSALDLAQHALETAKADAKVHAEDARIAVAQAQRKLAEVDKKIAQSTVQAPVAGLAVIQTNTANWPERRPYRLGDQVQSGAAPVMIYDFRQMQVRSQIGEMDISRAHVGQDAFVSSPTLPGRRYRGKVAIVEELAQDSNVWQGGTPGKKVFGVLMKLAESDPEHLRPGMTVDVEIVLDRVAKATMVPIRAVLKQRGGSVVYRVRGASEATSVTYQRVPVKVGKRNDLLMEVHGDLRAGDRVALERPPQVRGAKS